MNNVSGKKFIAALIGGASLVVMPICNAAVLGSSSTNIDVQVAVQNTTESNGVIDWYKDIGSEIMAVGIGLPNRPGELGKYSARVAAIKDAQRNLVELINGVQIDADTTIRDLRIENDVVHTKSSGLIKGAKIIEENSNPDGSYYVKMTIPLFGSNSVAAVIMPEIMKNDKAKPIHTNDTALEKHKIDGVQQIVYTGIIINAGGMDLKPTFSPVIYDINGRAIYGKNNIDADMAIRKGMVGYAKSVQEAHTMNRIGNNPLVINAINVKGGASDINKVNIVVSVSDAEKILQADQNSGILNKAAVIFVR